MRFVHENPRVIDKNMYGAFRFVSNLSSLVVVGLVGLRIPMAVGLTILEVFGMSGRWSLRVT